MTSLNLIMNYNFKERQLPDDFCEETFSDVKKFLHPTGFFTIVGMPGIGISFFMRFLATRQFATFIYIDVLSLAAPTKHDFFIALLKELGVREVPNDEQAIMNECAVQIKKLCEKNHVVLLFNRIDELGKEIDKNFLGNLRTLRHIASDKISMILSAHKSFYESSESAVSGANLDMFSNILYFPPYSNKDLHKLLQLNSPELLRTPKEMENLYRLSGGHYQLIKLALKSSKKSALLYDRFILSVLKTCYSSLTYHQRKIIQNIAFNKKVKIMDEDLLHFRMVRESPEYSLFSPLFAEYVRTHTNIKLPAKESLLFRLLKKNLGNVVTKDEIFSTLWKQNEEEFGSDWALNALIYRLRKNPTFAATGYIIESYKKVGYMLIKN